MRLVSKKLSSIQARHTHTCSPEPVQPGTTGDFVKEYFGRKKIHGRNVDHRSSLAASPTLASRPMFQGLFRASNRRLEAAAMQRARTIMTRSRLRGVIFDYFLREFGGGRTRSHSAPLHLLRRVPRATSHGKR